MLIQLQTMRKLVRISFQKVTIQFLPQFSLRIFKSGSRAGSSFILLHSIDRNGTLNSVACFRNVCKNVNKSKESTLLGEPWWKYFLTSVSLVPSHLSHKSTDIAYITSSFLQLRVRILTCVSLILFRIPVKPWHPFLPRSPSFSFSPRLRK